MCPLKKPLIFAHEVELIEIEYFISMLTYTGFGPNVCTNRACSFGSIMPNEFL